MPNPYFHFKQFTVRHDLCAMKVGTDGVLLGAWADVENAKKILDIGTGSGLIALMLAQRSKAFINAIDINANACKQAKINFENSPFHDRLTIEEQVFQDFLPSFKYDLLVSNPPYFTHSLKSPDKNRNFARHNDSLTLADLIGKSATILNPQGKLALILPFENLENANILAVENQLFLCRKTVVLSIPNQPAKRVLLEYSPHKTDLQENEIYIEKSQKIYSEEYIALTKDFYLSV
ncbi:tRNA1(Val) (adenine(37)-N6)-methyltransferase [Bacteroidia bacterium]|nr:tRNA1(Val) (adenine(37)-N6)-methyltransferase [Bacteroidia bacterium]GHU82496.1 tRNA1(Val) (adenine(37)-N6)-methyltransferase [Bacteroidia bacterium]